MDAGLSIEIIFAGIVIGMPDLGEERIVFGFPVKIPGWGHTIRTPVTRFEDRVCFGLEFMTGSTPPPQAG